jgi:hypothetical protein
MQKEAKKKDHFSLFMFLRDCQQTVDKAKKNPKRIFRVQCRNSWQRREAHQEAKQNGVPHRTIINYYFVHKNARIKKQVCRCCYSEYGNCATGIIGEISLTPFSCVELNNGYVKQVYGYPQLLTTEKTTVYSYSDVKLEKDDLAAEHIRKQQEESRKWLGTFLETLFPLVLVGMCLKYDDVWNIRQEKENCLLKTVYK